MCSASSKSWPGPSQLKLQSQVEVGVVGALGPARGVPCDSKIFSG